MKRKISTYIYGICGVFIGYFLLSSLNYWRNSTSSKSLILSNIQSVINVEPRIATFNINFIVSDKTEISATLEKFCETEQCVEQFHTAPRSYVSYVAQYKLANCGIPKSLSTITQTMLCFLRDPEDFKNRSLTMTEGDRFDRVCRLKHARLTPDIDRLTSRDWTHMAVVRNPIDRLLSGFVDKCIADKENEKAKLKSQTDKNAHKKLRALEEKWCLGCGDNLTCFIHGNYERMLNPSNENFKFPLENHFNPQNWFCSFSKYLEYYTILRLPTEKKHMKDFYEAIGTILQSQKVPQNLIDTIKVQISTQKTHHATSGTDHAKFYKNLLYGDKELLKTVVKSYFYDFTAFGFEFPQL